MCRLRNIALESVTEKCDRRTDRQTTDKVIPMCRYASQATQKDVNISIESHFVGIQGPYKLHRKE